MVDGCCGFCSAITNELAASCLSAFKDEELEQGVTQRGPKTVSDGWVTDVMEGEPGIFIQVGVNRRTASSPKGESSELSSGVLGSDRSTVMVL
jgi:hypothetical protein